MNRLRLDIRINILSSAATKTFRKWRKIHLCVNLKRKLELWQGRSVDRPFPLVSLFDVSSRRGMEEIYLYKSLIKLHFTRATHFSPSCTFNLTWPFCLERLIFFII